MMIEIILLHDLKKETYKLKFYLFSIESSKVLQGKANDRERGRVRFFKHS